MNVDDWRKNFLLLFLFIVNWINTKWIFPRPISITKLYQLEENISGNRNRPDFDWINENKKNYKSIWKLFHKHTLLRWKKKHIFFTFFPAICVHNDLIDRWALIFWLFRTPFYTIFDSNFFVFFDVFFCHLRILFQFVFFSSSNCVLNEYVCVCVFSL